MFSHTKHFVIYSYYYDSCLQVYKVVYGEDNKYATLIFIINNARIGYIKMYSFYSERQTDCECVKSLATRSSYRHMQAYKVVAE